MTAPMTTPEHTRNGRIALPLGMLLLTLCFLYLGISAWQERDRTWRAQQYGRAEAALRDLQQEQQSLRLQARIAAFSLSEDPDTLRLLRRISYLVRLHGLQDPEVARLRSQLQDDLGGFWQLLQQAGAKELQIHLAPDGVALLRMQRPERWPTRRTPGAHCCAAASKRARQSTAWRSIQKEPARAQWSRCLPARHPTAG